jgi:hypothetical protein
MLDEDHSPDLDTEAGVLAFCERWRARMVDAWEQHGTFEVNGFSFGGYVFATRAIVNERFDTELCLVEFGVAVAALPVMAPAVVRFYPEEKHTECFGFILREYVKKSEAEGTLVMGEAWFARPPEHVRTKEQALAWRAEQPRDMEDFAEKGESLFMSLEHRSFGSRFWRNPIARGPSRLEGWKEDGAPAAGRLVHLGAEKQEPSP